MTTHSNPERRPPQRFGDLRVLPWLPVQLADRTRARLGLREVLQHAHQVERLDLQDAFEFDTVTRFLSNVLVLVLRASGETGAAQVERGLLERGLDVGAIDQVLAELGESLWLGHPTRPFLQQAVYADAERLAKSTEWKTDFSQLHPSVVNGAAQWFDGAHPSTPRPDAPDAGQAAVLLVALWWRRPASNASLVIRGVQFRAAGAPVTATANGPATGLHLRPAGGSLLEDVLLATPLHWLAGDALPAWADPSVTSVVTDPYQLSSMSGAGVLLRWNAERTAPIGYALASPVFADAPVVDEAQERARHSSRLKLHRELISAAKAELRSVRQQNKALAKQGHPPLPEPEVPAPLPAFEGYYDRLRATVRRASLAEPDVVTVLPDPKRAGEAPDRRTTRHRYTFGTDLLADLAVWREGQLAPNVPFDRRAIAPQRGGTWRATIIRHDPNRTELPMLIESRALTPSAQDPLLTLDARGRERYRAFAAEIGRAQQLLTAEVHQLLTGRKPQTGARGINLRNPASMAVLHRFSEWLRQHTLPEVLALAARGEPFTRDQQARWAEAAAVAFLDGAAIYAAASPEYIRSAASIRRVLRPAREHTTTTEGTEQ